MSNGKPSELLVLTAIFDKLTQDEGLKALMGGQVRLYLDWAAKDAEMPYLVHAMDTRKTDLRIVTQSSYLLDVWTYGDTADLAYEIQARITAVMDESVLVVPGFESMGIRIWNERWFSLPTENSMVWRRSSEWRLRYITAAEVAALLDREEG